MNAGAHGADVASILSAALIFDLSTLAIEERSADQLGFAYRRSGLSASDVVVEASFELEDATDSFIRERMETYRQHRSQTQPGAAQNAGSVFKNPPGDSAGRLVEACGLKGFRVGGASVSELHANFFMAAEGATSQDVYDLVHEIATRVRAGSGVELETEVRFVGHFRPATRASAPEHA